MQPSCTHNGPTSVHDIQCTAETATYINNQVVVAHVQKNITRWATVFVLFVASGVVLILNPKPSCRGLCSCPVVLSLCGSNSTQDRVETERCKLPDCSILLQFLTNFNNNYTCIFMTYHTLFFTLVSLSHQLFTNKMEIQ